MLPSNIALPIAFYMFTAARTVLVSRALDFSAPVQPHIITIFVVLEDSIRVLYREI